MGDISQISTYQIYERNFESFLAFCQQNIEKKKIFFVIFSDNVLGSNM